MEIFYLNNPVPRFEVHVPSDRQGLIEVTDLVSSSTEKQDQSLLRPSSHENGHTFHHLTDGSGYAKPDESQENARNKIKSILKDKH